MTRHAAEKDEFAVAVLRVLMTHTRNYPAIVGAGPDWCGGCDWRGQGHAGHVAEVIADLRYPLGTESES